MNTHSTTAGVSFSSQPNRLDVTKLESAVWQLFSAGVAPSTLKAYQSGLNRYNQFCALSSLPPFPTNEHTLSLFVAYLYREGLCYTTVKTYLSGVRYMHIKLGLGDMRAQHMPQLEYITKGLRKLTSKGSASKRLPITPHLMHILRSAWGSLPNRFDAEMLWAASCMCFFGFLRSGEIVVPSSSHYDPNLHLSYGDVCLNDTTSPKFLAVHIKASKTDPFRQGISIYLGNPELMYVLSAQFWLTWSLVETSQAPSSFTPLVNH